MSQKDKFLQFPLSLLTQTRSIKGDLSEYRQMLNLALAWALNHAGASYLEQIRSESNDRPTPYEEDHRQYTEDYDEDDETHLALAWGADTIGEPIGSFKRVAKNLRQAQRITGEHAEEFDNSSYVRLRTNLFFEARDDPRELPPRNALCLCALLGILGDAPKKQISYERLLYAAHGCKDGKTFNSLGLKPWLTLKQIRQGIEAMQRRGLFRVLCVDRRFRYYSNQLDLNTLKTAVSKDIKAPRDKYRTGSLDSRNL